MNDAKIDINPFHLDRLTLNLCQDDSGYYWQTESGQTSEIRFGNAHDAIADIITLWSNDHRFDSPPVMAADQPTKRVAHSWQPGFPAETSEELSSETV